MSCRIIAVIVTFSNFTLFEEQKTSLCSPPFNNYCESERKGCSIWWWRVPKCRPIQALRRRPHRFNKDNAVKCFPTALGKKNTDLPLSYSTYTRTEPKSQKHGGRRKILLICHTVLRSLSLLFVAQTPTYSHDGLAFFNRTKANVDRNLPVCCSAFSRCQARRLCT